MGYNEFYFTQHGFTDEMIQEGVMPYANRVHMTASDLYEPPFSE